jgi:UDP-N-acetylmuramyl tripeptide synthase
VSHDTLAPLRTGLPARARLAVTAGRLTSAASRVAGRGSGGVIGGRLALKVDPGLLARLAAPLDVVLVSGTNGKTTTTRLIAEALRATGPVVSNELGANMPPGITAALSGARDARIAVIEVDEKYLPTVAEQTHPKVIALLNLSRDQLDRAAETRMLAQRWRDALARGVDEDGPVLVANADDPLVVWAAGGGAPVVWVAAGQSWREDAWSCPSCGGVIDRQDDGAWACGSCDFHRPEISWTLDGERLIDPSGAAHEIVLRLPGRANRANAATAAAVAGQFGLDATVTLPRLADVRAIAGRYVTVAYQRRTLRLLLAKNPAGWLETFDLLPPAGPSAPVLLSVNALAADGTDTSWLWDVDYTRLADRPVLVIGQRRLDLAVRLQVAGVTFTVHDTLEAALAAAPDAPIDAIANYTAFQQLRRKVGA